jgi:hypothetical protein
MSPANKPEKLPWALEILSVVASSILLGGLAATLWFFDNKPVFDGRNITLNTIVSVLSSASRATLLYTITECTSQWNWILFSAQPRRLLHFDRVDQASRGPLGSLKLLWDLRFRGG